MTDKNDTVSESVPQYRPAQNNLPFEEGKLYTYSDYCKWDDYIDGVYTRYELYEGIPMVMDAPSRKHQEILGELHIQIGTYLRGKPCKVYLAPFDVRLNAAGMDNTVVQPDILIVCDHSKLNDKGCAGAPDMTIEILSPGSLRKDRLLKLQLYEKYGVREYWIVDPVSDMIHVHEFVNGRCLLKSYSMTDSVPIGIFEDCVITIPNELL